MGGHYFVGRVLGRGGFGITYLGFDPNLNVRVAIKEFLPSMFAERTTGTGEVRPIDGFAENFEYGLERFVAEARALARFQDHPHIVTVVNYFRANGTAYLVMTYVEGITLMRRLDRAGGQIPVDEALIVIRAVLEALRDVHRVGLLHRDISPDNIYLTSHGQVKLMDFGAARYAVSERTQNLTVVLKSGFAPEEQYRTNGKQGEWTDIYAVGATLYRALTGTTPPPAVDRTRQDDVQPPSKLGLSLSPNLENAVMKSLAVFAEDRPKSAEALLALLPQPSGTLPATLPVVERVVPLEIPGQRKTRKRWMVASVFFLILSLGLGIGWGARESFLNREMVKLKERIYDLNSEQAELFRHPERQIACSNFEVYNADANDKHLNGSLGDALGRYERSEVRYISWKLKLDNNWFGMKSLSGTFKAKIYRPDGTLMLRQGGPTDATSSLKIDIKDSQTVSGGYGSGSSWLVQKGSYRVEFWVDNVKFESKTLNIYETPALTYDNNIFKSPFSTP